MKAIWIEKMLAIKKDLLILSLFYAIGFGAMVFFHLYS